MANAVKLERPRPSFSSLRELAKQGLPTSCDGTFRKTLRGLQRARSGLRIREKSRAFKEKGRGSGSRRRRSPAANPKRSRGRARCTRPQGPERHLSTVNRSAGTYTRCQLQLPSFLDNPLLLHRLQVLADVVSRSRLRTHLLLRHSRRQLNKGELSREAIDVEHRN